MADEEQLKILKEQGVEAWNRWREENSDVQPNLDNADFLGDSLVGANLRDASLNRADLRDADLTNADLTNARLTSAKLTNATLTNATLTNATLVGAGISNAYLRHAILTAADLTKTVLSDAVLTDADLSRTKLRDTNLTSADLCFANLQGADCRYAIFDNANLTGAKIDRYTKGLINLSEEQHASLHRVEDDEDDSASPVVADIAQNVKIGISATGEVSKPEDPPAIDAQAEEQDARTIPSSDIYAYSDRDHEKRSEPPSTTIVLRSDSDNEEGSKRISIEAYRMRLVSVDSDLRLAWFYLDQPPPNFESDDIAEAYRGLHDLCRNLVQIIETQRAQITELQNETNVRRDGRLSDLERRVEAMRTEFDAAKNEAEPILTSAFRAAAKTTATLGTSGILVGLAAALIASTLGIGLDEAIYLMVKR